MELKKREVTAVGLCREVVAAADPIHLKMPWSMRDQSLQKSSHCREVFVMEMGPL